MEVVIAKDERYPFYSMLTEIHTWEAKEVIVISDDDFLRIGKVFDEFEKVQMEIEKLFKGGKEDES